jgi:phage terminase large subunit GpA-like protein
VPLIQSILLKNIATFPTLNVVEFYSNYIPSRKKHLNYLRNNNYTIINKSRQLGISTLVAMYSLWIMLFHQDKTILVIATKQETAKSMVTKVKYMYDNLPSWLKGNKAPLEDNALSLKLPNNSFIVATASSSDAGRSYAASLLIIDEAAFITDIDRIYTSIITNPSNGRRMYCTFFTKWCW